MARARRFVFLDRDGTLIADPGYAHRIEEYAPLPGAVEALALLQEAGFGIAIVTNQSGIARGYYTPAQFEAFQAHLVRDFAAKGVRIEATYHCPHHAREGCACRKPATALLERARRELGAHLEESFVIGDKPGDAEMARRAGCSPVHVLTGRGSELRHAIPADVPVAADVFEAARAIVAGRVGPVARRSTGSSERARP
jgi:D-glycero-D-manno-heptose 1,7-bisphosphate phosphatase